MGKSTINVPCSIAMSVITRGYVVHISPQLSTGFLPQVSGSGMDRGLLGLVCFVALLGEYLLFDS